jgi:hypothetical protein
MINSHVNRKQFLILKHISEKSGLTEFWLGGSITYRDAAKILGVDFETNDYDLAIIGGEDKFRSILKTLQSNNFSIIREEPYYLKFNKIFQIIAAKELIHLDIAIVKNINYLGHFNWESIFWHFPSGQIYDPYNSIEALKRKKLIPVISVEGENPFILASRFLNLCARFNIDFCKNKKLFSFSRSLSEKIKSWEHKSYFHNVYAREHSHFNIFRAMIKATNPRLFIQKMRKAGLLKVIFPELNELIIPAGLNKELKGCQSVKEVINLIEQILSAKPKKLNNFRDRIKIIKKRLA